MDASLLPQFKSLLLCSIKSCITEKQMITAAKMIELFIVCFSATLTKGEVDKHITDLFEAWDYKAIQIGFNQTICRI